MQTNIEYLRLVHDLTYKQVTMACQVMMTMMGKLGTMIEETTGRSRVCGDLIRKII